jgi:endonuclease/exonuclease/phosphatase family metal-dependent hydrolase
LLLESDDQRRLGASLILWRAHHEASKGLTVLITGDFNSGAQGDDDGAYKIITGAFPPVAINATFQQAFPIPKNSPNFTATDVRTVLPRVQVAGNWATFTGFVDPDDVSQYSHIDFVFGGSNGGWYVIFKFFSYLLVSSMFKLLYLFYRKANFYKVENQLTDDGVLASDHRPVIADITL